MLRKLGMLGLMLFSTGAIMLPKAALAQDCYPAPPAEYHRVARERVYRDFHGRNDYRADQVRYREREYRNDDRRGRDLREQRYETRNTYGVHFRPEGRR